MLRGLVNNASRFAGGAAVAVAATPDAAHARALQPRSVLPARRVCTSKAGVQCYPYQVSDTAARQLQDEDAHRVNKGSEYLNMLDVSVGGMQQDHTLVQ